MSAPHVTLFRGFAEHGRYVASPFVAKLEARLRIGGMGYRVGSGSVMKAPRRKVPYVEVDYAADPGRGNASSDAATSQAAAHRRPETLADSALITRMFVEHGYLEDLNAALSPAERARDLSVRALLEDKLYFYQVRERWVDNYYTMRDTVLANVPFPIRVVLALFIFRSVKTTLQGQGVLRFTDDEAAAMRLEVWESINAMLIDSRNKAQAAGRDGPFWILGGATPTEADPTVFGFIATAPGRVMAPDTERIVRGFPIVVEYTRRIHDRYFSDYERWQD